MVMEYETLSVEKQDKTLFVKLNSDWNMLNPKDKKTRASFFKMMLNEFRRSLKEGKR